VCSLTGQSAEPASLVSCRALSSLAASVTFGVAHTHAQSVPAEIRTGRRFQLFIESQPELLG
jgi:hypothetical protein